MEKISVSNIVLFRRKSPNSQVTFIKNLRKTKPEPKSEEGGGHYWIHSLSAIWETFKSERKKTLLEKIEVLREKYAKSIDKVKPMFQKNISILSNFENFKFSKLKPSHKLKYLTGLRGISIIEIKGVPIQVLPDHVYTFEDNNTNKIAAIWFVAKINGYAVEELAIFTDALFRFLKLNYSKDYEISSEFCVAVDVMTLNSLRYSQILNKEVISPLNSTLESIKKVIIQG